MTWRICFVLAALAAPGLSPARAADGPPPLFQERWFWAMVNLQVDQRADELLQQFETSVTLHIS